MSRNPSPRHASPTRAAVILDTPNDQPGVLVTPPSSANRHGFPGSVDSPRVPFPPYNMATEADLRSGTLSPPLSPLLSPGARRVGKRLRARGGLKIQVNEPALRQYTDYDTSGTPRSALFSPMSWTASTPAEPDIQTSLQRLKDDNMPPLSIFDVFATKTVGYVLRDPAAVERMRHFADPRGRSRDVDFLQEVGEFDETVNLLTSKIEKVYSKFTGVAATSPMRLPLAVGKNINRDMRNASNNLLPRLKQTFEEANSIVAHGLAQDVYPEFLKYQVSLSLQTIRSGAPVRCHGFAEAFCMTNPKEYGNPMVYVSPGLTTLTGHTAKEMVHRTCGMFQGPVTRGSCVDWMRDGPSQHNEWTELVLNYTVCHNLFVCFVVWIQLATSF